MKTVTITIDENGDASVDLAGFKGKGCEAVQKAFALGKVTTSKTKPEYYQPDNCNSNTVTNK